MKRREFMDDINKQDKAFFGHPIGLATLFGTELWERFSYYGMKAILVYYLYDSLKNGGLGMDKGAALAFMSVYGSLVFMSSILGGWLSDRVFGPKNIIFYGGIMIMLGHILLAIPFLGLLGLFLSIFAIVIGTGMLKPNVSTMVGKLYSKDDKRRDSAFSIFYMGINIGAFLSPLVIGYVQQHFGYHVGFSLAAIGMAFGLGVFMWSKRKLFANLANVPNNPLRASEKKQLILIFSSIILALALIFGVAAAVGKLSVDYFTNVVTIVGVLLPIYYFARMLTSKNVTAEEQKSVFAFIPFFLAGIMFWSIQESGGTVLAVFADDRVIDHIGSFHIPPAWYQSVNPMYIIIFAPMMAMIWDKLGTRQPKATIKFVIGLFLAGFSFVIIACPGMLFGTHTRVSPWWLIVTWIFMCLGEVLISPIGYSIASRLAPKAFAAQMISLW
jgi:POT family proton-dependent oligopeptide transporter